MIPNTLPNPNTITSELALKDDADLKQMAMLHKNDPYVLPLIIAEDTRRKQVRQAAMAKMASVPQPKVNEADIAQIGALPENRGIGALPAQNLARMADGGIAGYATVGNDGNAAPNPASGPAGQLAFNNEPVMRMAGGGIAGYAGGVATAPIKATNPGGPGGLQYYLDVPEDPSERVAFKTLRGKLFGNEPVAPELSKLKGQLFKTPEEAQAAYDAALSKKETTATTKETTTPTGIPTVMPDKGAGLGADYDKYLEKRAPEEKEKPWAFPVPPAPGGLGGSQLQALIAPPSAKDVQDVRDAFRVDPTKVVDPFAAKRQEIVESQKKTAADELTDFETSQKERGDVYANRKERIAGQEAKLAGKEEENKGLALLESGLAIFGGTSPFAGANIAEGRVGVKSYREGQDKIDRAKERLGDAKDRIEDLETNYKDMSDREKRGLKSNINKAATEGQRLMLEGVSQAYNLDRTEATNLIKTQLENMDKAKTRGLQALISGNEQAGANYRAQLGLTAMPDQIKTAMFLGKGDLDVGYEKMAEAARDKSGVALATALETVNARREQAMLPPLTIGTFLSHLQQINLGTKPPKLQDEPTGKVRD
jgi:hypothetical protein